MLSKPSRPGDKPVGLVHVVVHVADGEQQAAVFTSRDTADAFAEALQAHETQYQIVETIVDGHAAGAPTRD